jgi:hypothetical protein
MMHPVERGDRVVALEMRPECERCGVALEAGAANAVICSYECTFCAACGQAMERTCPNCGGELVARPRRATATFSG